MTEQTGFILRERRDAVAAIVLARPERRNALYTAMYGEIAQALRDYQADDTVHAIIIRGEGRDFCAGNDISDFQRFGSVERTGRDPSSFVSRTTPSIDLVYLLMEIDKPLIGAVQGNAAGFGATLLLHCDAVIVEPDAKLRYPFVDLALVPEAGSTLLMRQRLGPLRAADILLNARIVSAEDAVRWGLASEAAATGESAEQAWRLAAALAQKPPRALRETKRLLRRDDEPLGARVTEEFRVTMERTGSPEAQAVFARMLQKK